MYTGLWDVSPIAVTPGKPAPHFLLFNMPITAATMSWLGAERPGTGGEKCWLAMLSKHSLSHPRKGEQEERPPVSAPHRGGCFPAHAAPREGSHPKHPSEGHLLTQVRSRHQGHPSTPQLQLSPTAELVLELLPELLDELEGLHQEDVLLQRRRGHGPQRVHVCPLDAHGVDLDASIPGLGGHLGDTVLGSPVCHDDGNAGDLLVQRARALLRGEGHVHGVLDGQPRHGALGQRDDAVDGLLHVCSREEGLEGEDVLHLAGVLDHPHPRGVGAHVQAADDVHHELPHGLELEGPHTAGAVDHKHDVHGTRPALQGWKGTERWFSPVATCDEQIWEQRHPRCAA